MVDFMFFFKKKEANNNHRLSFFFFVRGKMRVAKFLLLFLMFIVKGSYKTGAENTAGCLQCTQDMTRQKHTKNV